ncbi:MAG: RAMP superfamily CRISPR-associated protein [Thermodesulfovibrionales bacterium]
MIRATIKFESDFHIGSGLGKEGYIDSLFVKDSNGNPVIPGQTLKGIIRDSCMRIANSFGIKCSNNRKCTCHICEIFGKPSRPGKYLFTPAYLKGGDEDKEYPVRKRTSIDKETGTAKEEALFSTEVAPKDLEFEFFIKPNPAYKSNPNKLELKLELNLIILKAGILWTREIGGNRRRGLGHCRMIIEEPPIDKEQLKKGLEKLKGSNKGGEVKYV